MLCFSPGAAVESYSFVERAEMSRNKQPAHYFIATVVYEQMALCSAPCVCSCYGSFLITYTIFVCYSQSVTAGKKLNAYCYMNS